MDNQITVNMNNLNEDERGKLVALVEKANKVEPKVWKPTNRKKYYYIDSDSYVSYDVWCDWDIHENMYAIGNCFRTREEAEFAVEKLKVIAELKRFAEEHNEGEFDWNDPHIYKYCIDYAYGSKQLTIWEFSYAKYACIIFTSRKIAEQAIEAIGADRLKKYYFES